MTVTDSEEVTTEAEEPKQKKCRGGCDRPLREPGSMPVTGVPLDFSGGVCGTCFRYGPKRMPRDMALWAVAEARRMRAAGLI